MMSAAANGTSQAGAVSTASGASGAGTVGMMKPVNTGAAPSSAGRSGMTPGATMTSSAGTAAAMPSAGTPAAASGSAGLGASAAAGGAAGTAAAAGAAAMSENTTIGSTLPSETDPASEGAFDVQFVGTAPGLDTHSMFVPSETGTHGKHPMVVWTCGNSGTVSFYMSFLQHISSHGFFIVADKGSTSDREAEVASQNAAIDWILAENAKAGGVYEGKFDVDNIAVMGHSLGSLASFATAAMNEHVATSIHFSGGLTGNPVGFDESWLAKMTKPAAFLCGGNDTQAGPSCAKDFEQAPPTMQVFYGVLANADHIGPFLGPRGGDYGTAGVAWLRWQLASDPDYKNWFSGNNCQLCSSPWTSKQRNLD
jgi:dienelactone hydrolase